MSGELTHGLFTTAAMRDAFCDRARLQGMLDFEAALARAGVRTGLVSGDAATAIAGQCDARLYDLEVLARGTASAGNPAIPLVQMLTAKVAQHDAEAARFVHWGATSQDAMDTGLVLQLRAALDLVAVDLERLCAGLEALTRAHAATALAGRTWLQQATPVTLGLKAAGWLSACERHQARIAQMRPRVLALQFGGAAGTLAALGARGPDIAVALAAELDLALPDLPWHTQRDRVAEVATTLGLLVGTLAKIARDVSLMAQTEVGEVFEPSMPGRGGSSTMPHKRNPVSAAAVLSAGARVPALVSIMLTGMIQEHERGLGGWHAEWETLPEICRLAAGALAHVAQTVEGLDVDAQRMTANLGLTGGLILAEAVAMALAERLGKHAAHELVEHACRVSVDQRIPLRTVLADDATVSAHLTGQDLDRLLDPRNYVGEAQWFIDRVLATRPAAAR